MIDLNNVGTDVGILGGIATILAFVPTTLSWIETRRTRKLAERDDAPTKELRKDGEPRYWRCGIYHYPPLSQWNLGTESEPTGPLAELARQISIELGKPIKFEFFSYDGFYAADDELPDLVIGMFETPERKKRMIFSEEIYKIGLQGICRHDQRGDILTGLLEGPLKVAVYKGEVGWEFLKKQLPDAIASHRFIEVAGGHQMDTMIYLSDGHYDVVLMDSLSCFNFLKQKNNSGKYRLAFDEPLDKFSTCVALNKRHSNLLHELNDVLIRVRNSKHYLGIEAHALMGFEKVVELRGRRAST